MNKQAVHHITDTLGADTICKMLDVSEHSVRGARTKGVFSGSWYGPLKVACDNIGIPCPLDAFAWKQGGAKKHGIDPSKVKVHPEKKISEGSAA